MKNNNVTNKKDDSTKREKWGDSEHDTRLHRNLKPHKGNPEYNPEWKSYRN